MRALAIHYNLGAYFLLRQKHLFLCGLDRTRTCDLADLNGASYATERQDLCSGILACDSKVSSSNSSNTSISCVSVLIFMVFGGNNVHCAVF